MSLEIRVVSASSLQNLETLGKSDPYVSIDFQGVKHKTEVKSSTLDPVWDETLTWELGSKAPRPDGYIDVWVKDYERLGKNRLLGKATIALRNLIHAQPGTPIDYDLGLLDAQDSPTVGTLALVITYNPPPGAAAAGGGGGGGAARAGGSVGAVAARTAAVTADMAEGEGVAEGGSKARKRDRFKAGLKRVVAKDAPSIAPPGEEMASGGGGMPLLATPQARHRDKLSNVRTKFQVRVRVVEGRQLLGDNMNPVCRVVLGGDARQTRVHRGTSQPWFDQIFFYQLELLPEELLGDFVEFKVCNSSGIRSTTTVGAFKCEVGMVYDQPEHALVNRWLVLANPDEETPTVQGYLKVSVAVLGPGDVCPDLAASRTDADDVEANLLWSAGVHLQPATLSLSVYCAQNLPRMDAGTLQTLKEVFGIGKASKELVDPYLLATYAGVEVQTKVLYTNENPEFCQDLHMGVLFPSMCNQIKITLKDWDRVGQDDTIGTATIPISAISAPGDDGYLPTFGPAWVSVYGARREWELLEGEKGESMNAGVEEGCAYRGRVLLALRTHVGNYPPAPSTRIDQQAFNGVRRYRSTRRFMVVCQLSGAWRLEDAQMPLELEVSMGNFGNKLENTIMPSSSSSHPTNPLFDGCKYYFLPWGEAMPFVTVACEWEDITYRLHCVNHITAIAKALREDLARVADLERGSKHSGEGAALITQAFTDALAALADNCGAPMPALDPVRHSETSLDRHLRDRRRRELDRISSWCRGGEVDPARHPHAREELQAVLNLLEDLCEEPQNGLPDVFLWLMSGTRRLAYVRLPAHAVLYAHDSHARGHLCGAQHTYTLVKPDGDAWGVGGLVRASVWLGREEDLRTWKDARPHLQQLVYAETYENQVVSVPGSGKWGTSGLLMTRPVFSDADGRLSLAREDFSEPDGWTFHGDWLVDPEPSVRFEADAGRQVFTDEVFEVQVRVPGGTWLPGPNTWVDARGDPHAPRDELQCPEGWRWADAWAYDLQRAVDGDGWEYTVESGLTGWSPQQKIYHLCRRRRWWRERNLVQKVEKVTTTQQQDGWEYAPLFRLQFHALERKVDMVRRRRWRRRLVPLECDGVPSTPCFKVKAGSGSDAVHQLTCPRMYVMSAERHVYQLRAHLYQARDLAAGDKTGLSDPYCVVSFYGATQQSVRMPATLCPTWDQTLIFDQVELSGTVATTAADPPSVMVEVFDWDARGAPEFLGRALIRPQLVECGEAYVARQLQWFPLARGTDAQGELLASFELLVKDVPEDLPMLPPTRGDLYMVPFGIRPLLQKTRVEVLCWGVRNMATFELQGVTRPSIEFECGGARVTSPVMKNLKNNPNFEQPHLVFDVELPKEELYMPPLTLRVVDHRAFGNKPVVATAVVRDLHAFTHDPRQPKKKRKTKKFPLLPRDSLLTSSLPALDKPTGKPGTVDTDVDWWAKYYASVGQAKRAGNYLAKGYERVAVLGGCLEAEDGYNGFRDLVDTVALYRGRGDHATHAGEFKGTFRVYPLPGDGSEDPPHILDGFPSPGAQEVVARVYVVAGKDLAPKDPGGASDPYVVVRLGKDKKSSKKEFRPNTLNPVFGHVIEVRGTLPLHKDLVVEVWDHDTLGSDDLIGETTIDLENRFLTRHRATVGLPRQYHVSGPNAWRDAETPVEILTQAATLRNMELVWQGNTSLTLHGHTHTLQDFEADNAVLPPTLGSPRERLALHVLHKCFPLVPEHVESRPLMHPARPGLPQGALSLWVDLFHADVTPLPPPVDITPRKPHRYELRVVVYNVFEAPLQETSLVGREKMSDVYVKGWLQGTNNVQKTDIHYRCMDGEANFNWRLVFGLEVLEAEQVMVVERKEHPWSLHTTTDTRPPQLTLQLWDNDLILRDDYLSEMTLDLCRMPKPAKSRAKAGMDQVPHASDALENGAVAIKFQDDDGASTVNIFEARRLYGFLPFTRVGPDGATQIAGKVELEVEVVTEEEAKTRPAGRGRDEPNMNPKLPEPDRPATSFLWITSPWKSFRHVLWRNYKWYCITLVVLGLLFLFLFLMIYSLPGATIDYLLGV